MSLGGAEDQLLHWPSETFLMLLNIYSHRLLGGQVQQTTQRVCSEMLDRNPRPPNRAPAMGQLVDPVHGQGSPELRVSWSTQYMGKAPQSSGSAWLVDPGHRLGSPELRVSWSTRYMGKAPQSSGSAGRPSTWARLPRAQGQLGLLTQDTD